MIIGCEQPIAWPTLVDYWAGDLREHEQSALEEHLMACENCSRRSAGVASITETFRGMLPPVVTRALVEQLRARGVAIRENTFAPGERKRVLFPRDVELLIHQLSGLPLAEATRVSFLLRSESAPEHVLMAIDEVPFDRATGSILVACQQHYAEMPPDTVAEVTVHGDGEIQRAQYTILHEFC